MAALLTKRTALLMFLALMLLLLETLLLPDRGFAQMTTVTCNDTAVPPKHLPTGSKTTDLEVTGPCEVKAGNYTFRNINIYKLPDAESGGSLSFDDAKIDLFAESIVVENKGSMIAGSEEAPVKGPITIHLWGAPGDHGVTCKSDNLGHCGVPSNIWGTNPAPAMMNPVLNPSSCKMTPVALPGGVKDDCFYDYDTLDDADMATNKTAYFGHKVLALSYGGTLQLFGKKGAIYSGSELSECKETDPSCAGTSWIRLKGSLKPGDTSLVIDGKADWQSDDHIVITTTDYLPGHSEELIISDPPEVSGNTTTINFSNAKPGVTGVQWPHNGQVYDYTTVVPARLGLAKTTAETRAAVALLTRSIRIVSEGDTPVADSFTETPGNYFGGHTIVRQGFASYQVQGVEFQQLGQGGAIMHYPVHFHMARSTPQPPKGSPAITFVKDCSVHDSMTRWITIHATQGVLLARNVGYLSIGHGFYLEDGTETDNKLYSNIGIFARAAVNNVQNPRQVPGILTTTYIPNSPW